MCKWLLRDKTGKAELQREKVGGTKMEPHTSPGKFLDGVGATPEAVYSPGVRRGFSCFLCGSVVLGKVLVPVELSRAPAGLQGACCLGLA